MDRNDVLVIITSVLMLVWLWQLWDLRLSGHGHEIAPDKQRQLRPRTSEACEQCREEHTHACGHVVVERPAPRPWSEVRSPRGRKKTIKTEGYACVNKGCAYYDITDEAVHAVIGYGCRGKCESIQYFFCQACGKKVTERWGTPMYRLKTGKRRVSEVLTAMGEGLDVSAAVRVFGHAESTVRRWIARAGEHSRRLHEQHLQNLELGHVQLDELVVTMKGRGQALWLWVAMEAKTKLMPVLQLGPRKQEVANLVVHSLAAMLAPGCVPAFTSDGLNAYYYALTAHFGEWQEVEGGKSRWVVSPHLVYAQLKKIRIWRRLVGTEHRMLCGTRAMLTEKLHGCGLRGNIQTAFVERINLTLRQSVAGLARRTWSIHVAASELEMSLLWFQAYYHFCRPHESLRQEYRYVNPRGEEVIRCRSRTPMMAAGLTRHRWTVREFLLHRLPAGC